MPLLKKLKQMLGMSGDAPMMKCEEVLDRLFDYLDGELPDPESEQVKAHLEACKACYPRAEFERAFLDALSRAKSGESCPQSVRDSVLAAIREAE